jgi:uncharacterized RDD family membrane protein YckC
MARDPSLHTTPQAPDQGHQPAQPAQERAGLGRRLVALFLDWIMCLLIASLIADPRREALIPSLVLVLEYTFFLGFFGQTPGMRLAGIRCVSVLPGREGHPIGAPRAALRGLLLALAIPALIMDQDQRGLHDKAAASQMVRA